MCCEPDGARGAAVYTWDGACIQCCDRLSYSCASPIGMSVRWPTRPCKRQFSEKRKGARRGRCDIEGEPEKEDCREAFGETARMMTMQCDHSAENNDQQQGDGQGLRRRLTRRRVRCSAFDRGGAQLMQAIRHGTGGGENCSLCIGIGRKRLTGGSDGRYEDEMRAKVSMAWRCLGAPADEGKDQPKNACQEYVDIAKPAVAFSAMAHP